MADMYCNSTHKILKFIKDEQNIFLQVLTNSFSYVTLRNMAPVIPGIFQLWDYIERNFAEATAQIGRKDG